MMTQIAAIFRDSYRLIKSGYLFWISFILTAMCGLLLISIGNDEKGLTLFFGLIKFNWPIFAKGQMAFKMLYFHLFDKGLVGFMLTWFVPILGLVSTSTLFPGFMKQGSIDVALSKPISRPGLFALKYLGGLLFVLLQVCFFSLFVYLCLGVRLGEWGLRIFLIIPIVTLVFSYLYVINVLLGVVTRSPVLALVLTLFFWFVVWGVQRAEWVMHQYRVTVETRVENIDRYNLSEEQKMDLRKHLRQVEHVHSIIFYTHLVFPKIQETKDLVTRYVVPDAESFLADEFAKKLKNEDQVKAYERDKQIYDKTKKEQNERSLWYVIGTSLFFEGIVFALACIVFCRRDY